MQEKFAVQTRGDVTVNAMLTQGAVQESITVKETPADSSSIPQQGSDHRLEDGDRNSPI